jgi:hypothetical protein
MINDIKDGIRNLIIEDGELLEMLAENVPAHDEDGEKDKANSVLDYLEAVGKVPVFITIRADDETRVGQFDLTNAFVLIRCYNNKDKSFYTINKALDRVRKLLTDQLLPVQGYSTVQLTWETTGSELPDDGLDLIFRESRYRIQLI